MQRWFLIGLLLLAVYLTPAAAHAEPSAEGMTILGIRQQDTTGAGRPNVTIIDAAFATERDQVRVYDRGQNMVASNDWRIATDFTDDVWVFDVGADGTAQLIITFQQTDEGLVAELWDDRTGDGRVLHQIAPTLELLDSPFPTVRVLARDGWWQRADRSNFNLHLTVDGPLRASFSAPAFLEFLRHDGEPDFTITVRDTTNSGRPDWQWVDAWPKAPETSGPARLEAIQNVADDEYPITGRIFWYLLGSGNQYNKDYHVSPPPIKMDWSTGQLAVVGEFVASRFNDEVWFMYSQYRPTLTEAVPASFESPFGFYDLAQDDDGYPELQIRMVANPPRNLYIADSNDSWTQQIRYSWDQDNTTTWDYKLELFGQHPIETITHLPDFAVQMIAYEQLPQWVVERTWSSDFVAVEQTPLPYWTSEGIYETPTDTSQMLAYNLGNTAEQPQRSVDLPVGMRHESTDLAQTYQPYLYFSPIDRKLHLRHATQGAWDLGDAQALYYANLNGDAYLDQWLWLQNTGDADNYRTISRQLNVTDSHLIYSDSAAEQVLLRAVTVPPSLFETLPPTNHAEWQQLGSQLDQHQRDLDPHNLRATFDQFAGDLLTLNGARLRDFRFTDGGGFRFVLTALPHFSPRGADAALFAGLASGEYLVAYTDQLQITPLTPPDLTLTLHLAAQGDTLPRLAPRGIELSNAGIADANGLTLYVEAQQGEQRVPVLEQRVGVHGMEQQWVALDWQPTQQGAWTIVARLFDQDQQQVAHTQQTVTLGATAATAPAHILHLSSNTGVWWQAPLLLLVIGGVIALIFSRLAPPARPTEHTP